MGTSIAASKGLGRYFEGKARVVYVYPMQRADNIEVHTGPDWAGCIKTRKSTSGGCTMLGSHLITAWSGTQPNPALPSGEADYYGSVKACGAGLGHQALLGDLGAKLPLRVWTDSTAAMGVAARQGVGKICHLDTSTLWMQQAVRS